MPAELNDINKRSGAMPESLRIGLIMVSMLGLFVFGFELGTIYMLNKLTHRVAPSSVHCSTHGDQAVTFRYDPKTNSMSCETADYTE